eukprot:GEMP01011505.1.p1 GENE.GEMP01011505.1~~GEMP01011505.1.p1  ORF type:complete len:751 (+),score=214.31 GEMP01011505.1:93-2345(+)
MPALFLHVTEARERSFGLRATVEVSPNVPPRETSVPSRDGVMLEVIPEISEHVCVRLYHDGFAGPSGAVDIPVDSLVPNQLWNVWYALEGTLESVHLVLYLNADADSTRDADVKARQLKVQKMAQQLMPSLSVSRNTDIDASPKSLREKTLNNSTNSMMAVAEDAVKVNEVLQSQNKELRATMVELEKRNGELLAQVCGLQKARAADQNHARIKVVKTHEENESTVQSLDDLQVELAHVKAQNKSWQLRVEGMERDVQIYQQRVSMVDTIEEQMRNYKIESMKHLDERMHVQQRLDACRRQSEQASEEILLKLSHAEQELERSQHRTLIEKQQREVFEHNLAANNTERRKIAADKALLEEDVDALNREMFALKAERDAHELLMRRQRERIKEVEEKWSCERVSNLQRSIDEHDGVVLDLRTQLDENNAIRRELEEELRESNSRTRSLDGQLVKGKERARHLDEELQAAKDGNDLSKELQTQNNQLKDRLEQVLCDTRLIADNFERDSMKLRETHTQVLAEKDALTLECALKERTVAETERRSAVVMERQESLEVVTSQCEEFCRQGEVSTKEAQRSQKDFEDATRHAEELMDELQQVTEALFTGNAEKERLKQNYETQLKLRERESAALLTRVQALSSDYSPLKGDIVDETLAKWIHAYQPAVPFVRISVGLYAFGKRQVLCKISNDKPVFRVGGGFLGFDAFLDRFSDEELTRILYDNDNNAIALERLLSQRSFVSAHAHSPTLRVASP